MTNWLLLHYKLPSQPSALRVYIWRKLQRLGALLLNDVVWILPETSRTLEHFQWLVAEIQERQGEVYLWKSSLVLGYSDEELVTQFQKQVEQEYKTLLQKLNRKNPDMSGLSQEFQQITARDYFQSDLGRQVRKKLLSLRGKSK